MVRPNIAVIGCGYWGKNVVRTFHTLGALRCVCDVRSQVLDAAREKYGVQATSSIAEVLADPQVEGVAIAAPAVQHYQLVRQALEAGNDGDFLAIGETVHDLRAVDLENPR